MTYIVGIPWKGRHTYRGHISGGGYALDAHLDNSDNNKAFTQKYWAYCLRCILQFGMCQDLKKTYHKFIQDYEVKKLKRLIMDS